VFYFTFIEKSERITTNMSVQKENNFAYIDGANLVNFLKDKKKINIILSPAIPKKYSILLKRTGVSVAYIHDQGSLLKF